MESRKIVIIENRWNDDFAASFLRSQAVFIKAYDDDENIWL